MIAVGEETGALDDMMDEVADHYGREVRVRDQVARQPARADPDHLPRRCSCWCSRSASSCRCGTWARPPAAAVLDERGDPTPTAPATCCTQPCQGPCLKGRRRGSRYPTQAPPAGTSRDIRLRRAPVPSLPTRLPEECQHEENPTIGFHPDRTGDGHRA
ncbi:MAG: hypothetical protein MZW92_58015 [Comamonadaceae bacterium]|nr:hypothetical protein [Comamonadaceae bacterium]